MEIMNKNKPQTIILTMITTIKSYLYLITQQQTSLNLVYIASSSFVLPLSRY